MQTHRGQAKNRRSKQTALVPSILPLKIAIKYKTHQCLGRYTVSYRDKWRKEWSLS